MRTVPDEVETRRFLELGLRVVPEGDNEPRVRLMMAQAFLPWAYPKPDHSDEDFAAAQELGEQGAEVALRIGRHNLASGCLDAVSATMMVQGRYADSKRVIDRRLGIVDRIQDPLEVGDIHSLASWVANYIGHYRAAVTYAERGFEQISRPPRVTGLHEHSGEIEVRAGDLPLRLDPLEHLTCLLKRRCRLLGAAFGQVPPALQPIRERRKG